jgi:hypothetical protein
MNWKRPRTKGSKPNRGIIPVYVGEREENHGGQCPGVGSNIACSNDESAFPPQLSSNIALVQPDVNADKYQDAPVTDDQKLDLYRPR